MIAENSGVVPRLRGDARVVSSHTQLVARIERSEMRDHRSRTSPRSIRATERAKRHRVCGGDHALTGRPNHPRSRAPHRKRHSRMFSIAINIAGVTMRVSMVAKPSPNTIEVES
jgi:hypothetical protein